MQSHPLAIYTHPFSFISSIQNRGELSLKSEKVSSEESEFSEGNFRFGKLAFRKSVGRARVVSVRLSPNHRWVPGSSVCFPDGLLQVESLDRWVSKRDPRRGMHDVKLMVMHELHIVELSCMSSLAEPCRLNRTIVEYSLFSRNIAHFELSTLCE
ncbi:hypothetical protein Bca4012_044195 [Brassica carinata]|uniref:Uncharacterized protein n=2 Tax=Brassica TaxID=3705 RepID=A0A3P6DZZ8_BRAOL|nr:unnamed protein product [Brassica napus]VDD31446.1 unnamed protein product [Brassica oleracea]